MRFILRISTLLLVLLAHVASLCLPQQSVAIKNGTLVGSIDPTNKAQRFLGIPYAQPPVGRFRLRQAVALNSTFGTLNATKFGFDCYGTGWNPNPSEDCLTLNIWRSYDPSQGSCDKVPVMVWFYGGGLTNGYTADPLLEGTNMVRISREIQKPIIFVSVNYRLGSLGFLNGKQMAELGLLNLGMLDQRLALRWVQENIAAFGGDPKKVTIAGQSAGAVSVYSHMISYGGRDDGLFRGAIMQSGGAFPLTYPNNTAFQSTFDSLIANTSCFSFARASAAEQLDCIRTLPISVYRSAVGRNTGQSIDGNFAPTSVQFAFPAGKYVKVAVIVGCNTDEGTTSAPTGINTRDQLKENLRGGYFRPQPLPDSTVNKLLELYPSNPQLGCPYNTGSVQISPGVFDKQACSIFGDIVQHGPARMIAQSLTKNNGNNPVYRYRFNHLPYNTTTPARGISTGTELSYIFSNRVPKHAWDQALAYDMTSAWVSFTYHLDPNPGRDSALPFWPQYRSNATNMVFNGYGSAIEIDDYRADGIKYIINTVLPDSAQ